MLFRSLLLPGLFLLLLFLLGVLLAALFLRFGLPLALPFPFGGLLLEQRGLGKPPLSDEEILGMLQKMVKQRQESLAIYQQAGRDDLSAQESEEIAIIMAFMPKQMDDQQVKAAISAIIAETGATSVKDMGRIMAALKERFAGQMDFAKASGTVKALLG